MGKIKTAADLKKLHELIQKIGGQCFSDETKAVIHREQDAYKNAHRGFFEQFKEGQKLEEIQCKHLNRIYGKLPTTISISPEIAFILGADEHAYKQAIDDIERKSGLTGNIGNAFSHGLRAMAGDPVAAASSVFSIAKAFAGTFKQAFAKDAAFAARNEVATNILTSYKLVELAPRKYALKRGEWKVEYIHEHIYQHDYVSTVRNVGVDASLDFERLKQMVDPDQHKKG